MRAMRKGFRQIVSQVSHPYLFRTAGTRRTSQRFVQTLSPGDALREALAPPSEGAGSRSAKAAHVVLRPPSANADNDAVNRFLVHVGRVLEQEEHFEIEARGVQSVRSTLRSLALAGRTAEFDVSWAGSGGQSRDGDRFLQFKVQAGVTWDEHMRTRFGDAPEFFVQASTSVLALAQAVAFEEEKSGSLRLHCYVEDPAAMNVLAKALATAPSVRLPSGYRALRCVPNIVRPGKDNEGGDAPKPRGTARGGRQGEPARLFVFVRGRPAEAPPPSGATFTAIPPGANADPAYLRRFRAAVHDRLRRGDEVDMECRGPDAVEHAVRALCNLQGHTAEFQARWIAKDVGGDRPLKSIGIRARRGATWLDFNRTDFRSFELFFASPKTAVGKLASAVAQEVRNRKAVSVHVYSDNKIAIGTAVKALATVPTFEEGGEQVVCVPSLGHTKDKQTGTLRLYIRRDADHDSKAAS